MERAALAYLLEYLNGELVSIRNYKRTLRPLYVGATQLLIQRIRTDLSRMKPDKERYNEEDVKALARTLFKRYMSELEQTLLNRIGITDEERGYTLSSR